MRIRRVVYSCVYLMKLIYSILLISLIIPSSQGFSVMGGSDSAYNFLQPTTVSLQRQTSDGSIIPFCSAVLIGPRHVMTAAHCLSEKLSLDKIKAKIYLPSGVKEVSLSHFGIHSHFLGKVPHNEPDFGLLILSEDISEDVSFPVLGGDVFRFQWVYIAGFGLSEKGDFHSSGSFHAAKTQVDRQSENNILLVQSDKRTAPGDSGGPLYYHSEVDQSLHLTGLLTASSIVGKCAGFFKRLNTEIVDWVRCSFESSHFPLPNLSGSNNKECTLLVDALEFERQNIQRCRSERPGWDIVQEARYTRCWPITKEACSQQFREEKNAFWDDVRKRCMSF